MHDVFKMVLTKEDTNNCLFEHNNLTKMFSHGLEY